MGERDGAKLSQRAERRRVVAFALLSLGVLLLALFATAASVFGLLDDAHPAARWRGMINLSGGRMREV
jgi:hypothetical protein